MVLFLQIVIALTAAMMGFFNGMNNTDSDIRQGLQQRLTGLWRVFLINNIKFLLIFP
jgi:hypothetical protein